MKNLLKEQKDLIPSVCPSCNEGLVVEGIHLHCFNQYCPERIIKQISYWCKDYDDMSESTIRTLYEEKLISNVIDLYNLHNLKNEMIAIDGFGEKKVDNILNQIEKNRELTVHEFINRLGINLVGLKAVKKMNINTLDDFWNFKDSSSVIGQKLIEYKSENPIFLNMILKELKIKDVVKKKSGLKVAMTGKGHLGRKELIDIIGKKGCEFESSISKEVNILVCEDVNGDSSKLKKARKLGIKLMTYSDFF